VVSCEERREGDGELEEGGLEGWQRRAKGLFRCCPVEPPGGAECDGGIKAARTEMWIQNFVI
jgi:hypothetical protein